MTYTVLASALERAKERSGATDADDAYLLELLVISAGTDPQAVTQYRPFFVAAKFLEQNLSGQAISEVDGVKYTGQATPIASLMALQASIDKALNLAIPEGMEAIVPGQSTGATTRYRSRSLSITMRP